MIALGVIECVCFLVLLSLGDCASEEAIYCLKARVPFSVCAGGDAFAPHGIEAMAQKSAYAEKLIQGHREMEVEGEHHLCG